MSEILTAAVEALNAKLGEGAIDGSVKFNIEGEGAVRIDETGASADDSDADCVLTASPETFRELIDGALDPTQAFMSGRLRVDGDMGVAMKLGALLA
jgi:putative sterol carrier protein